MPFSKYGHSSYAKDCLFGAYIIGKCISSMCDVRRHAGIGDPQIQGNLDIIEIRHMHIIVCSYKGHLKIYVLSKLCHFGTIILFSLWFPQLLSFPTLSWVKFGAAGGEAIFGVVTKSSTIGTFSHAMEAALFGLVCSATYTAFGIPLAALAVVFNVIDLLLINMRLISCTYSISLLFSNRSTNALFVFILYEHE